MGAVIHVILLCTVRYGHQTPQLPKFRSLGRLRNVNFILYVEAKSYTEFALTGIDPEFSSRKASNVTTEPTLNCYRYFSLKSAGLNELYINSLTIVRNTQLFKLK